MDVFYRTHNYLVGHIPSTLVRRDLMDEIDWSHRLIGIKGTRGVGKTTFLLQYAKEKYGSDNACLYVNMNNFYFSQGTLEEFIDRFVEQGGRVLLIDQVFKIPHWSSELRKCYDKFPELKIVFTGSSVMRLKDENSELNGIVASYNLRGFSFREFLNLQAGLSLPAHSLEELLSNGNEIAHNILQQINPLPYFQDYLHHGFYPFFLEKANFSENLLKTMNMIIEVDILLIKQIELKYLPKIKKLFYLLATEGNSAPNVSQLATDIQTSRATVMNYMKYLADARLINLVYPKGGAFPKKPSKVLLHNSNICYCMTPSHEVTEQEAIDTFFANALWKDHTVSKGEKGGSFLIDGKYSFRVCTGQGRIKYNPQMYYAINGIIKGNEHQIPLWLFGFLY